MSGALNMEVGICLPLSNSVLDYLVSPEDYDRIRTKKVSLDKDGYASVWHSDKGKVPLHRLILSFPDSEVDHINGDKLDNRRSNLRIATKSEQSQNRRKRKGPSSSQFVGVTKRGERWAALIKKDGVTYRLGRYDSERDAALAYNGAALALYGKDAGVNDV